MSCVIAGLSLQTYLGFGCHAVNPGLTRGVTHEWPFHTTTTVRMIDLFQVAPITGGVTGIKIVTVQSYHV